MPGEDSQLTTPAGGNQPEQTGLPPGQENTADFLNSLGPHTVAETPEQSQIKELEGKVEEAKQMYSNMTDEEKARLSPLMREKYEALFGGQKPASETNVTATAPADISVPASITTEPSVNPEAGTKPLPGITRRESMAGVPGASIETKPPMAVTPDYLNRIGINPNTLKPIGYGATPTPSIEKAASK